MQVLVVVLVFLCAGAWGASDILRKVISKSCSSAYTMGCFKMDMIQLVDLLDDAGRYRLLPGIDITRDNNTEGTSLDFSTNQRTEKWKWL